MAKPYRRRKNGKLIGNYRVTLPSGRDLNLKTKDAQEALARARLAVKGKWPPEDAAAAAAAEALDPGAAEELNENVQSDQSRGAPGTANGAPRVPVGEPSELPPPTGTPEPPEPLEDAAAAAAAEVDGGAERVEAEQIERERAGADELNALMAELTDGKGGGELVDGVADMGAAFLLWCERKGAELGWKWTLQKRTGQRLETEQPGPDSLMRKCLRIGLKVAAIEHFPSLASRLTSGWAIVLGMVGGGAEAVARGRLVDIETGKASAVGAAMREAAAPPPDATAAGIS